MIHRNKFPVVSVIMPSYNHEGYINEAIQSVLDQTFSDFELLIIDDASTDNSLDKIKFHKDSRIKVHALPKNVGGAGALNYGIGLAQGEFIAIINSDDRWVKGKLEKQVLFLSKNQDVAAVFSHASVITSDGLPNNSLKAQDLEALFSKTNRTRCEWLRFLIETGNCLCHPSVLVRKKCYDNIGLYDERYRQLPDYDLWLRLTLNYQIYVIQERLVHFRLIGNQNASDSNETNNRRMVNENLFILKNIFSKGGKGFLSCFDGNFNVLEEITETDLKIKKTLSFFTEEKGLTASLKNYIALEELYELFSKADSRSVLESKYNFTQNELFSNSSRFSPFCQNVENAYSSMTIATYPASALASELLARIKRKPLKYLIKRGMRFVLGKIKNRALQKIKHNSKNRIAFLNSSPKKNECLPAVSDLVLSGTDTTRTRILFIGIVNSPHTYHWIKPLLHNPSYDLYFYNVYSIPGAVDLFSPADNVCMSTYQSLQEFIDAVSPHIIHTMHTQQAAYALIPYMRMIKQLNAKWMHSLWGSDIYFWGRYPDHKARLTDCLSNIDILFTEGERDTKLAKKFNYHGEIIEGMPAFGGFDIKKISSIKRNVPSSRKEIAIKGYVDVVGRFFVGLHALELIKDLLEGYTINVISPSEPARYVAELFAIEHGVNVRLVEKVTKDEIFSVFARSRVCMGISLSDGLPASLVEGMAMGAFPIQTNTSVADEWVEDGVSGFLVQPNDPFLIAEKLRKALTDDDLVDNAAVVNFQTVADRVDSDKLGKKISAIYDRVADDLGKA